MNIQSKGEITLTNTQPIASSPISKDALLMAIKDIDENIEGMEKEYERLKAESKEKARLMLNLSNRIEVLESRAAVLNGMLAEAEAESQAND